MLNHYISAQIFIFEFSGTKIIIVLKGGSAVADGGIPLPPKYGVVNPRLEYLHEISIKPCVYLSIIIKTISYNLF